MFTDNDYIAFKFICDYKYPFQIMIYTFLINFYTKCGYWLYIFLAILMYLALKDQPLPLFHLMIGLNLCGLTMLNFRNFNLEFLWLIWKLLSHDWRKKDRWNFLHYLGREKKNRRHFVHMKYFWLQLCQD